MLQGSGDGGGGESGGGGGVLTQRHTITTLHGAASLMQARQHTGGFQSREGSGGEGGG